MRLKLRKCKLSIPQVIFSNKTKRYCTPNRISKDTEKTVKIVNSLIGILIQLTSSFIMPQ